jgi:putative membrane protein
MEKPGMAAFFAFLHHLAAFTLFAALVVELVSLRGPLTLESARRLQIADMMLGIAAGVLLVVGLARVFYLEKGAYYYFHTWTFIAKFTLFVIIALVSIIPTIEFLRWRPAVKAGQVPSVTADRMRSIRSIVHYELVGVVLIILFAALMAKGIGLMS